MNPWCERHGTWHPVGECDLIDELRSNAVPRVSVDQLRLAVDDPKQLCCSCGSAVPFSELDHGRCSTCAPTLSVPS